MTLEEAKIILKTYKLPMTTEQAVLFKQALELVNSSAFKLPGT